MDEQNQENGAQGGMTRESKIGLIVAGSFLVLVCIVVASKWNRGDQPPTGDGEEQQAREIAAAKPSSKVTGGEAKKTAAPPKSTAPAAPSGEKKPNSLPPLSPPPTAGGPPSLDTLPLPPRADAAPLPKPDSLPLPPIAKPDAPGGFPMFPDLPVKPSELGAKPADTPTAPILQVKDDKKPAVDIATPTFPPPQPLPPLDDKKPGDLPKPMPIQFPKDPPITIGKPNVIPPKDAEVKKPDSTLTFPPIGIPLPEKDTKSTAPNITRPKDELKPPPLLAFPKDDAKPGITPIPNDSLLPPGSLPRIGANDLPSTPTITTKPIVIGDKPAPSVTDVSAAPYACQAVDTSFAILSMRFYGNEKYADALLAYNREYAKFVKDGENLLASPPRLTTGQTVLHPPLSALERMQARPATAMIPATPVVNLAKPSPLNPTTTPGTIPAGAATRSYKVANPAGESILDIAERQLGNRNLWTEINRINQSNPGVRPPALIPFGTDLKLP